MASIAQLVTWALKVKNQTQPEGNTETVVGGLFEAIVGFLQDLSNRVANLVVGWYWQEAVDTAGKLTTTYPSPKTGWAALVKDKNQVYVWNGTAWTNTGIASFPTDIITPNTLSQTLGTSTSKAPSEKAVGEAIEDIREMTDRLNGVIYGNLIDMTPIKWVDGYVSLSGILTSTVSYNVSLFISVLEGQKFIASLSGSQNTLLVSGYSSNNQDTFLSSNINILGTITNPGISNIHEFTIPNGVNYIRIGKHNSTDKESIYLKCISDMPSSEGLVDQMATITPLLNDIPIVKDTLFGGGVIEDLTENLSPWIAAYVDVTGKLIANSTYQTSDFIAVKAGSKYKLKGASSSNVFLISGYSSNNQSSFVSTSINIKGDGTAKEEIIIIPKTVNYIRLCNHPGLSISEVYFKEVDSVVEKGLIERIDVLEKGTSVNVTTDFRLKRCATFSLIADDCFASDILALEIANKYNIPLSFAIQTSKIELNGIDFYKNAYKNGSSILSHSVNHVISESEITESKKKLQSYSFPTNGYVSPGGVGTTSPNLLSVIDRFYGYANSMPNIATIISLDSNFITKFDQTVDPYRLTRISLEAWNAGSKDSEKIKEMIDFAIENNLLILMYIHAIPSTYKNSDGTSVLTIDNMDAICAYLADKRDKCYCKVLNTDQAVKDYYNYKNI